MISRITNISLDEKIWRYIRRNKKFVFSELMLVTGAKHEYLLIVLQQYELKGYLKLLKNDTSITSKTYIVIKKLGLEVESVPLSEVNQRSFNHIRKLLGILKEFEKCNYMDLEKLKKFSRGHLIQLIKDFKIMKILSLCKSRSITKKYYEEKYLVNHNYLAALDELFINKDISSIDEALKGKPLIIFKQPKYLPEILEIIMDNEVLQRDELSYLAKVTRFQLTSWWQILKQTGVVTHSIKENPNGRPTYIFNTKKAKHILKHLDLGAWEKDKELRQLWLKS